jgi:WD40 repeat protein
VSAAVDIPTLRRDGATLDAPVTGACFNRAGTHAAFAAGDGSLHIAPATGGNWQRVAAHDGAIMAAAPDTDAHGFLTAGDDGRLLRISVTGAITELFSTGGKWIEHVISFAEKSDGLIACAAGKQVHLFDAAGARLKTLATPSTVAGIAFDGKGKRIAAAHYGGASLWFTQSKSDQPRKLDWKGSHIGVALHPAAEALVTSMQENALHGWRLSDAQHMQMTGYPTKCESLGFTRSGKYLASAGADAIVIWPFTGGGPMGKPPLERARLNDTLCTRIACHPKHDIVAAGYSDGTVSVAEITSDRVMLIEAGKGSPVTALAFSPDGAVIAWGTEAGNAEMARPG